MSKSYLEITQRVNLGMKKLHASRGATLKGFSDMARAATEDGALSKKTKELIALAIGVSSHCDACIGFHTKALIKLGVTREEFEEALGMAVYMGGGPSLMYAADAMHAYEELLDHNNR